MYGFQYPYQPYQQFYPMYNQQQTLRPIFNGEQFRKTEPSSSTPKVLTHQCNIIKQKAKTISTGELTSALDVLLRELKQVKDQQETIAELSNTIIALMLVNPTILASVVQHNFFTLLSAPLIQFIEQWQRASYLNENDLFAFRKIVSLVKKLLKNVKEINQYPSWLFDSSLLNVVTACLTNIAKSDTFLQDKNKHESNGFIRLLSIYIDYQKGLSNDISSNKDKLVQLVDATVQCLTSNLYIDVFNQIQTNKKAPSVQRKIFLIKCPLFLISYNGSRLEQIMDSLLSKMLPHYNKLFNKLIPLIDQWKRPTMRAVTQLIKIINHGPTNPKILADHLPLIDHILTLIDTPAVYNNVLEKVSSPETNLIGTAVNFLANMISEPTILAHIKQKKVTSLFLRLTSVQNESLVFNIYNILAYTTSEEDISKMRNPDVLLSTVTKSLQNIMTNLQSDNNNQVEQLLEALKGLTQHDQLKEAVLKQNTLPFLLDCINKLTGEALKLLLETLWSLSFSQKAALELRTNTKFLEKVQTLSKNSNDEAMKKASEGLVWKLVKEPAFLEKVAKHQQEENDTVAEKLTETTEVIIGKDGKQQTVTTMKRTSIVPPEQTFQHDIMISYCHADKDLIIKLHAFLVEQGFKIWIDLNNMFGPAMSAMADAVENSEFVIMCMSDSYKQSTYCQAEAEYAFGCKRRLLPLIVRPNYKPDGWLGFMIGSRIYVDFGRFDFETACDKLMNEISLQRKRPLPSKVAAVTQQQKTDVPAPVVPTKLELVPTPSNTLLDKYMKRRITFSFNQKSMYRWKESDVLDFLYSHQLHEIMPLCETMDGGSLIQLYKMCASNPNGTFSLLNDELQSTCKIKLPIGIYTRFLSVMTPIATPPSRPPPSIKVSPPPTPTPISRAPPMPILRPPPMPILRPPPLPIMPRPPSISHRSIQNRTPVQSYIQDLNSPYDILVTSDASPSQVFRMAERWIPQVRSANSTQGRRTLYI